MGMRLRYNIIIIAHFDWSTALNVSMEMMKLKPVNFVCTQHGRKDSKFADITCLQ